MYSHEENLVKKCWNEEAQARPDFALLHAMITDIGHLYTAAGEGGIVKPSNQQEQVSVISRKRPPTSPPESEQPEEKRAKTFCS